MFVKGKSGNPEGRKPGKTPATALKKIIAENMPDILEAMIEQARQGDVQAGKALMDKIIPTLKSQNLPVSIPAGENLAGSGKNVLEATLSGDITPDSSALLLTALSNQARIEEFTSLEERIVALEGGSNVK